MTNKKAKVFSIYGEEIIEVTADEALKSCIGELDVAMIIGIDKYGQLFFRSSDNDSPNILLTIKRVEYLLIGLANGDYINEEDD